MAKMKGPIAYGKGVDVILAGETFEVTDQKEVARLEQMGFKVVSQSKPKTDPKKK
jgi:H2-forming N5,N10-methylenetetrahydromethanopterin dehydrogenase-like enzyme